MSLAALALKSAVHARLAGDAALTALTGPGRVLDRPPQGVPMPYVLHGPIRSTDYSTATEKSQEHQLVLEVWTDAASQRPALEIAARIAALLDDAAPTLAGTRLVSLAHRSTRMRREPKNRAIVAEIILKAVTEG